MRVLFAFLGLALGVSFGYLHTLPSLTVTSVFALAILGVAFIQKETKGFLVLLGIGICLGLLGHIPHEMGYQSSRGVVIKTSDNYFLLWRPFFHAYVYQKNHAYQVGDILNVSGYVDSLVFTTYEGRFDFGDYLRKYGVNYEISGAKISPIFQFPLRLRSLQKNFLSSFNEESASLLDALLFGKADRDVEVIGLASAMNSLFLISASGLFVQRALSLVKYVCLRFGTKDKTAEKIEAISSLLFFPLSFRKIGIARVILSKNLRYLNRHHAKTKLSPLGIIGACGIIQIFLFPYSVFQSGFLLGYGVSLALSLYGHMFQRIKNKRLRKLAMLGFITLFMVPSSINYGGAIHILSVPIILLITPVACVFAFFGLFSFLLFPIPPLMNFLGGMFGEWIRILSHVDFSFALPRWNIYLVGFYYLLFFLCLSWNEAGFVHFRRGISYGAVAVYCLSFLPIVPAFSAQVSFINVGQGDSILIRDRDTVVLLDTGGNISFDMAQEVLIPYLHAQRIYHIDCLIASHHDYDHIGAKESLEANFEVRSYVDEASAFPLSVGSLTFQNWNIYPAQEENDASLVIQTELMGKKWVFMGDAPVSVEKQILADGVNVDCDILKIGHHGSITSSCVEWLMATSPEEAIISVGAANSYGHPSPDVLLSLEGLGIRIRRTDQEGTITYAKPVFPWV